MKVAEWLREFWTFLQDDSWASFAVTLLLAFIIIKFVFFPGLSLVTGTSLPLVIVESCSMYHYEDGFEQTFESSVYGDFGISIEDTKNWVFQNGFAKGDVIFVVGVDEPEVGDVIIFMPDGSKAPYPLIHRIVDASDGTYGTKGDNYLTNSKQLDGNNFQNTDERDIPKNQIIGKALFKVPFVGWAKLIFYESGRPSNNRGLC